MGSAEAPLFLKASTLAPEHSGIGEVSIPLLCQSNEGELFPSGTAAVISCGLAITARHVIDDYFARFGSENDCGNVTPKFRLLSYLALKEGQGVIPLTIGRMWLQPTTDIALLELQWDHSVHPGRKWNVPCLALTPPPLGSRIAVLGYPNSHIDSDSGEGIPNWDLHPRTSTGIVEEIHHLHRDTHMLPFPCFRTNARFDGGMSGSPIFNDQGHLAGIVCSGMPLMGDEGHVSYGSLLWPAMGIVIDLPWSSKHPAGHRFPLYELASDRIIGTSGLERISVATDGNEIKVTYRADAGDVA